MCAMGLKYLPTFGLNVWCIKFINASINIYIYICIKHMGICPLLGGGLDITLKRSEINDGLLHMFFPILKGEVHCKPC